MALKTIESIELNSGLSLTLHDASKKVAADRWQVKLKAQIDIDVALHHFSDKAPLPAPLEQLRAKLGEKVTYTYEVERNFVDQEGKASILGQMQASVLAKKPYYNHPEFAGRFIIKAFARSTLLPDTKG